jgi:hypothetical protein
MKTLTITAARAQLGYWLNRAKDGAAVGIVCGDVVVELRPVAITAIGYAEREYGLTAAQMDRAARRLTAQIAAAKSVPYKPGMLTRGHRTHQTLSRRRQKAA